MLGETIRLPVVFRRPAPKSGYVLSFPIYGKPKTKYVVPAVTNTYCLPPAENVTGFDRSDEPKLMSQSGFPVTASSAKKLPSSVPEKTRPPAVANVPTQDGECSRNCHFIFPVVASSARIAPYASSPLSARSPPAPMGNFPISHLVVVPLTK